MKGPFERLKYDLRRIWECPQCGHKVRTDGTATTQFCRCGKSNTNPAIAMKLVGDGARRLVPPVPKPAIVAQPDAQSVAVVEVIEVTTATVEETPAEDAGSPLPPNAEPSA